MEAWPSWRRGPDGEARIFERPEDVPPGWVDPADWRPQAEKPAAVEPAPEPVKRRARREVKA